MNNSWISFNKNNQTYARLLVSKKPSKLKCKCNKIINCHHVVNSWPKKDEWRRVYNESREVTKDENLGSLQS